MWDEIECTSPLMEFGVATVLMESILACNLKGEVIGERYPISWHAAQ